MIRKEEGRDRWHGATLKTFVIRNFTPILSRIDTSIVRLAMQGVIPACLTTKLIQQGGVAHV